MRSKKSIFADMNGLLLFLFGAVIIAIIAGILLIFMYGMGLFLFSSAMAANSPDYQLPIQAICNGKWYPSVGSFICTQDKKEDVQVRFKIPPTKGHFRALNCLRDLTADGRPEDYNYQVDTGFWFWRNTIIEKRDIPIFSVGTIPTYSMECPIGISVAGQDAGTQKAIIVYRQKEEKRVPAYLKYTCGDNSYDTKTGAPGAVGEGLGRCPVLQRTDIAITAYIPASKAVMSVQSSECAITEDIKLTSANMQPSELSGYAGKFTYKVKAPIGVCVLKIELQFLKNSEMQTQRADIMTIGRELDRFDIAMPTITKKKEDWYYVFKPYGATLTATDVYKNGVPVWSSGTKGDDVYHIERHDGDLVCATAYSDKNSMSGACLDVKTNKMVPYFFN